MKLKDVPPSPAYLVFHDAYDNGAMDVYARTDLKKAEESAKKKNEQYEQLGHDDCGFWRAYTKLPRKKVYKYYPVDASQETLEAN